MRLPLPAFLFLLLLPFFMQAQQNNFRVYSLEDGLPQSEVRSICEDSRGYLWVGTNAGGAARFDGLRFTVFDKKAGLSGNEIYCITEDHLGRLWFGTDEGISVYDGYKIRNYSVKNGLTGNNILKIIEDSKGNIWAGTTQGLNIIKIKPNDSLDVIIRDKKNGLSGDYVFDMVEDRFGRIWLATVDGGLNIVTLDPAGQPKIKIIPPNKIPSINLLSLGKDKDGNIWAGTWGQGAFLVSFTDTLNFSVSSHIDLSGGYDGNRVWKICADNQGRIWFATDKAGVFRLNGNDNYTWFSDKQGFPNNQVLTLYEDSEGNMWFGTMGSGLCKYYGDYFAHYTSKEILSEKVYAIAQSKNGCYWIGTGGKGLIKLSFDKNGIPIVRAYNEQDGLFDPVVRSVAIDKNGIIWLGTANSGLFSFDGQFFTNYSSADGLVDNRVNCIFFDSRNRMWCGTMGGLSIFDRGRSFNISEDNYKLINNEVQTITEDQQGVVWIGTLGGIARFKNNEMTDFDEKEGLLDKKIKCIVCDPRGNVWIGSFGVGVYMYDASMKSGKSITLKADEKILGSGNVYSLIFSNDTTLIVGTDKGFKMITMDKSYQFKRIIAFDRTNGFIGIENNLNAIFKDKQDNVWFGTAKGITRFTPSLFKRKNIPPKTHLTDMRLFFEPVDWSKKTDSICKWSNLPVNLILSYKENHITFYFEGISLTNPQKVLYRYMLEGADEDWSPPLQGNEVKYTGLEPGEYTFKVIAANEYGTWNSDPQVLHFVINPPYYRTWWFYSLSAITIITLIFLFIKWREAKLKRDKAILEQTVKERTAEVVKQKEIVEEQKQEITDSIHYASRIQRAILPATDFIHASLPDYFILYKPRDIVSGDFYWTATKNSKVVLSAADCTGHGVPGAFMSMLGVSYLNEIVIEKGITRPDEILNNLRGNIVKALQQKEAMGGSKDGMDIALITVDLEKKMLQYAGANNSLVLIRDNAIKEFKADKMPIAIYDIMEPFRLHETPYQKGDTVYMFSDGYADQFGGPRGRKFMSKRFKELLLSIHESPMNDQRQILDKGLVDWINESHQSQNDDICVIGLRL